MKFLLLNGTLKVDSELSNTFTLCQMVKAGFEALGHECELVTLSEMEYKRSTDDVKDDLQPIIQKMFSIQEVKSFFVDSLDSKNINIGDIYCIFYAMINKLINLTKSVGFAGISYFE